MRLNTLKPAPGARKRAVRLGRGIGSGFGKTCGFGHKGQKSRSGYSRNPGFEGGQMPLYRRLPHFGFTSPKASETAEIGLGMLSNLGGRVDLACLRDAGLVGRQVKRVKVILSKVKELDHSITICGAGIRLTTGARAALEKLGGKIEE